MTANTMSTQGDDTRHASQLRTGLLVTHEVDGENVGIEVRHVEPSPDGSRVLLVFAGGATRWHGAGELVDVVTQAQARAAEQRLQRRRNKTEAIAALRAIADAAEAGMPLPSYRLELSGALASAAEVTAVAVSLGGQVDTPAPGHHAVTCRFGGDEYSSPVELRLSYMDRDALAEVAR
jgi:hypothetical protein